MAEMFEGAYALDLETGYDPDVFDKLLGAEPRLELPSKSGLAGLGREALDEMATGMGLDPKSKDFSTVPKLVAAMLRIMGEDRSRVPMMYKRKHESDIAEWREEQEGAAMLHPFSNTIVGMGLVKLEDWTPRYAWGLGMETSYFDALTGLVHAMNGASRVVTFNGWGFDRSVLNIQCAVNGIQPAFAFLRQRRYWDMDDHVDMRCVLGGSPKARGKLWEWCARFGHDEQPTDPRKIRQWIEERDGDKLAAHAIKGAISAGVLYREAFPLVPPNSIHYRGSGGE